jgi:hypothetical protein
VFAGLVRVARSVHRARRPDYLKLVAWAVVILGAWGVVWLIVGATLPIVRRWW